MSYHEYEASKRVNGADYPFYALIMAAMRQADTVNLMKLKQAFPKVWDELQARYWAPCGLLPGEPVPQELQEALEEVKAFTVVDD